MDIKDFKAQAAKVVGALVDKSVDVAPFAATPDIADNKLGLTQTRFCNSLSEATFELLGQIAEGQTPGVKSDQMAAATVVTIGRFSGTHSGVIDAPGLDFPATGKDMALVGSVLLQFDAEGKVTYYQGIYDFRGPLVELGILPVSARG